MSQAPARNEQNEAQRNVASLSLRREEAPAEGWLSRVAQILFGWKTVATRADLEVLLASQQPTSGFSPAEAAMLKNVLTLRDCRIERIMVPRADIVAVQQDITLAALIKVFESGGHSRLVVYNDTLDDPTGMVHIRDMISFIAARAPTEPVNPAQDDRSQQSGPRFADIDLATPLTAANIVREIIYAPPSMTALDLLAKMQATRIHLALVIDEYGGTDGLVSMEDLVERIVGDIADEHDEQETPAVTRQSDGSFVAAGRASLDEVRAVIGDEFDVGDAGEEVDTLGGYLVIRAGHVPVRGELVPGPGGFEAEVLDADPRRVKRVKISRRGRRTPPLRDAASSAKPPPSRAAATEEPPPS